MSESLQTEALDEEIPSGIVIEGQEDTEITEDTEVTEEQEVTEAQEASPVEKSEEVDTYIDFTEIEDPKLRAKVEARIKQESRVKGELSRKYADAQKKAREYEEQLAEVSKPREVTPPSEDDWYADPEAAAKKQEKWQAYVNEQAKWSFESEQLKAKRQAEEQAERQEKVGQVFKKAESAGIPTQELINAASVVDKYLPADMQSYLIDHDFGPQLIKQLASNPVELQTIANLNPYQVGAELDKMARAYKPNRKSSAPPPVEPIKGSGVTSPQRGPKGATFE